MPEIKADASLSNSAGESVTSFFLDVYDDRVAILCQRVEELGGGDTEERTIGPVIEIDLNAWNEMVAKVNQVHGEDHANGK
jgi:hypothetical protein